MFYTGQREKKRWRLRGEIQRKRITKRNIFLHTLCRRGEDGCEEDGFDKIKNKNPTRLSSRRILGRDPKRVADYKSYKTQNKTRKTTPAG